MAIIIRDFGREKSERRYFSARSRLGMGRIKPLLAKHRICPKEIHSGALAGALLDECPAPRSGRASIVRL